LKEGRLQEAVEAPVVTMDLDRGKNSSEIVVDLELAVNRGTILGRVNENLPPHFLCMARV
jgi:hypothetical protein